MGWSFFLVFLFLFGRWRRFICELKLEIRWFIITRSRFIFVFILSYRKTNFFIVNLFCLFVIVQDGVMYRFKGGEELPKGNVTDQCPPTDLTPCPALKASAIFRLDEKKSKFGTNFAFMKTRDPVSSLRIKWQLS